MSGLSVVKGGAPTIERAIELTAAIKAACYENGKGLSVAAVIGCLEIAKLEIWRDAT